MEISGFGHDLGVTGAICHCAIYSQSTVAIQSGPPPPSGPLWHCLAAEDCTVDCTIDRPEPRVFHGVTLNTGSRP